MVIYTLTLSFVISPLRRSLSPSLQSLPPSSHLCEQTHLSTTTHPCQVEPRQSSLVLSPKLTAEPNGAFHGYQLLLADVPL